MHICIYIYIYVYTMLYYNMVHDITCITLYHVTLYRPKADGILRGTEVINDYIALHYCYSYYTM